LGIGLSKYLGYSINSDYNKDYIAALIEKIEIKLIFNISPVLQLMRGPFSPGRGCSVIISFSNELVVTLNINKAIS